MSINAVSILEIRVRPGAEARLEHCLAQFVTRLQALQGCLAYGVTRSVRQPRLWVFSGYWCSREEMVRHFSTVELDELVRSLVGAGVASIRFGSFAGAS
ncbi:hypothetical protein HP532_02230 [Pseudomonas sp. CrR25]|nr:hypothetical protein [Pseudomonas sp. CrR25]